MEYDEKIKLIDIIIQEHPAHGVDKGWIWYVGGMRDTGEWYREKMLLVPGEELQAFYDNLLFERAESIRKEKEWRDNLTEQDKIDLKTVVSYPGGGWSTVYEQKRMEKHARAAERKLFGLD